MEPSVTGQEPPEDVLPLRVLYIDENEEVANSTISLLKIVGFEARACYDATSALLEAAIFRPAVCLIDSNALTMGCDELSVRLRTQAVGIPLVLVAMTVDSNEFRCSQLTQGNFDLHIVKPLDPFKLVAVLDALCSAWLPGKIWEYGSTVASPKTDSSRSTS